MATRPPGRYRERAQEVIRATLAGLGRNATLEEQRFALRDAYPFGERAHWPYKVWLECVRDALGVAAAKERSVLKFRAAKDVPEAYLPFLQAIAADPTDQAPRLIFSDYLEERGDPRAEKVRQPRSSVAMPQLIRRLGGVPVHLGASTWAALLTDHIMDRDILIRYPEIDEAIRVEESRVVLDLFRRRKVGVET